MSDQSAFHKKNLEVINPEAKPSLLEELGLPPKAIKFLRNNARRIQVIGVVGIALFLAWTSYDYYVEKQRSEAASFLASSLSVQNVEERISALANVAATYSNTAAANWSRLELGHLDFQAGRLDEALEQYNSVLDSLSADSPLFPLMRYRIAQTLEQKGDFQGALSHYQYLANEPGFTNEGIVSVGLMNEKLGNIDQALEFYNKYLGESDSSRPGSAMHELISDRVAKLTVKAAPAQVTVPEKEPAEKAQ